MPWTPKKFMVHKQGMTIGQAKRGASIANGVLKSCLKSGKSQKVCEGIAIATALKNISKGGKRK